MDLKEGRSLIFKASKAVTNYTNQVKKQNRFLLLQILEISLIYGNLY